MGVVEIGQDAAFGVDQVVNAFVDFPKPENGQFMLIAWNIIENEWQHQIHDTKHPPTYTFTQYTHIYTSIQLQ